MRKKRIISLGAGVQSSALVIMAIKGEIEADYAIFCDTGSEKTQTYDYLKSFLLPYAKDHDFEVVTIKYDGEFNTRKKPLDIWYYEDGSLPFRVNRGCTDNWKIRPMYRYLKKREPQGATIFIGYSYDELHRMRDNTIKGFKNEYPLIDMKISRNKLLRKIYNDWKLPMPVKSGCFMCPFARKQEWIDLYNDYPELFDRALKLENNAKHELAKVGQNFYPLPGNGRPLTQFINNRQSLFDFIEEDPWCGGSCMT